MSTLSLHGIKKRYASQYTIHGVDLSVEEGEFVVFVGPSGCGKSTLLRMIAGLEEVSEGRITIAGVDVTHTPASNRNVAMVFQSYALYPHMTVLQNLSFGMRMRKVDPVLIEQKLARAIDILQLQDYLQRRPGELSGGQCQRVAIGRAMVQEPTVFLFDEPLSNLDAELRHRMRIEISALHRELGKTMIYVTHDQVEAMTLADKIVVLRAGLIEQVGRPLDLYANPCNEFVAGFIGSPAMNFLKASYQMAHGSLNATVSLADGPQFSCAMATASQGGACRIGIRPSDLSLSPDGILPVKVMVVERLGGISYIHAQYNDETLCIESRELNLPHPGEVVRLSVNHSAVYVFDATGKTISALKANGLGKPCY
jgi:lactose/L-arabinose transport system ATP-binding protein